MGFFSDLVFFGPGFAIDGLKLDIDNAIDDIKSNPAKAAVKTAIKASQAHILVGNVGGSVGKLKGHMFDGSPECDDWIEETGGRDEDYSEYYEKWLRRTQR
jgi:hypothetical protein